MLAGLAGLDLTLTTNGALLASKAQALVQRRAAAGDGQPRLSRRRRLPPDERRRLPGRPRAGGDRGGRAAGLRPIKVNMVVKRGVNEDSIVPMARHFRGSGHILRFIEFMDVGQTNGWRLDDVVPAAEILARVQAAFPLEPLEPNYAGEVAGRWRYQDGAGEIGVIASVTRPFCRRLHPGAALGRRLALHLPVRRPRPRPARRHARREPRTRRLQRSFAGCGSGARIGIPRSARRRPNTCPRSRCRSSAAEPPPVGRA